MKIGQIYLSKVTGNYLICINENFPYLMESLRTARYVEISHNYLELVGNNFKRLL